MGKSGIFDICCPGDRQFAVGHETILFDCALHMTFRNMPPGPQVYLVHRDGLVQLLMLLALFHPSLILPLMLMNIGHNARGLWSPLNDEATRLCFINCLC